MSKSNEDYVDLRNILNGVSGARLEIPELGYIVSISCVEIQLPHQESESASHSNPDISLEALSEENNVSSEPISQVEIQLPHRPPESITSKPSLNVDFPQPPKENKIYAENQHPAMIQRNVSRSEIFFRKIPIREALEKFFREEPSRLKKFVQGLKIEGLKYDGLTDSEGKILPISGKITRLVTYCDECNKLDHLKEAMDYKLGIRI